MSNYNLDDPVELLCALTEINSVNSTLVPGAPGESEIADFIGKWFSDRDFDVTRLEGTPGRPSIVATSKGATTSKKIMLNGHIDTVTVASYEGDGCKAVRKDGNVYGRGTFDMKGGLAGQMIAAHRAVQQGDLFCCVRGEFADGHVFAEQAIRSGASALLVDTVQPNIPGHVTQVVVSSVRDVLGSVASATFGHPSRELKMTGITGTNGINIHCIHSR